VIFKLKTIVIRHPLFCPPAGPMGSKRALYLILHRKIMGIDIVISLLCGKLLTDALLGKQIIGHRLDDL